MAKTAQDVMQLIREQGIKMVDFKMVDINGQYRHVTIPAQNFTEETMTDRKSTRLNSSHNNQSRMPSSA